MGIYREMYDSASEKKKLKVCVFVFLIIHNGESLNKLSVIQ